MDHILLIERDPFVRTDMFQALQAGFPEHLVFSYATLEEADHGAAPRLLLIDAPASELAEKLSECGWKSEEFVCVLTGSSGRDVPEDFAHLLRPFTEDMLLGTVRDALKRISVGC